MLPNDIGKFVGTYFQVLGWLIVGWMALTWMFYDRLEFNITFVLLFWAAAFLKRHSPTARIWTLWFVGLAIVVLACLIIYSATSGPRQVEFGLAPPFAMLTPWETACFVLLFWGAATFRKHRATTRTATRWIAGLAIVIFGCCLLYSVIGAPRQISMGLSAPSWRLMAWQIAGVWGLMLVVVGIPFGLLLTPQARREFGVEPWRFSLRTAFIVMTIVGVLSGVVVWVRGLYYVQVRQVRTALDDHPEIEKVWIGTNDDVTLEVEEVFFTLEGEVGAVYSCIGPDAGEAKFRRSLERALRERRAVELPDYLTPLVR